MAHPVLVDISGNVAVIKETPITSDKFVIGRGLDSSFVVEDVNVSRTHCMFERINGEWTISDKSSNGTWLNGHLLDKSKSHKLSVGDIVGLSESLKFVFKMQHVCSSRVLGGSTKKTLSEDDILNIAESVIADVEAFQADYDSEKFDETLFNNINRSHVEVSHPSQQSTSSTVFNATIVNNAIQEMNSLNSTESTIVREPITSSTSRQQEASAVPQSSSVEQFAVSNQPLQLPWEMNSSHSAPLDSQQPQLAEQPPKDESQKSTDQRQPNNLEYVEDELQCSICTEMFIQAMTLSCSHTFCKYCITQWQKNQTFCPICRNKITMQFPTRVVDNFIEKVMETASDELKEHRRNLILQRQPDVAPATTAPAAATSAGSSSNAGRQPVQPSIEILSSEEENTDDDEFLDDDMSDYSGSDWERDYDNDDWYEYNGVPGEYYGGYGHCYACGQRGHWANGCPNKRR